MKILFLCVVLCFNFVFSVKADDFQEACVCYQRADFTNSHWYKVKGLLVEGSDLNDIALKNGYYSNYNSWQTYFVIPWKEGGYSALEIPFGDSLPFVDTRTTDQEGKVWYVKEGWIGCY